MENEKIDSTGTSPDGVSYEMKIEDEEMGELMEILNSKIKKVNEKFNVIEDYLLLFLIIDLLFGIAIFYLLIRG